MSLGSRHTGRIRVIDSDPKFVHVVFLSLIYVDMVGFPNGEYGWCVVPLFAFIPRDELQDQAFELPQC